MTRVALAAVAALALAASACGGVENDSTLAKAAESTEATGSFAIEMTENTAQAGKRSRNGCVGAVDVERRALRASCTYPDGGSESVIVDDAIYFKYPESDGKWSKMSGLDGADPAGRLAPERLLRMLRSASERTERVGEEDVRGEQTTRYALTVDCEQAEIYDCAGKTTFVGGWIDGEGLVRRIDMDEGEAAVRLEFYDFGVPVEIEPPPAAEVVEAPLEDSGSEQPATTQP